MIRSDYPLSRSALFAQTYLSQHLDFYGNPLIVFVDQNNDNDDNNNYVILNEYYANSTGQKIRPIKWRHI